MENKISLSEDILQLIWKTYYTQYICTTIKTSFSDKIIKLFQVDTSLSLPIISFNHPLKSLLWAIRQNII